MSALASLPTAAPAPKQSQAAASTRLALLGTGNVGNALLQRLSGRCTGDPGDALLLAYVGNSRRALARDSGLAADRVLAALGAAGATPADFEPQLLLGNDGTRIVVDATASDSVAQCHAHWLAQGIHVVTACKRGQGESLSRWRAIRSACRQGDACYGDSATVGAGLPLLRALRELRAGGDRILAIRGVLSGSLAWLLGNFHGDRPFSALVREARAAGYTEPDPRDDLSGEDVRRKLLILARAAGFEIEAGAVVVESLVAPALAAVPLPALDGALSLLDAPLQAKLDAARASDHCLRFVARLEQGRASVGLDALRNDDPLAGGSGTDNRVAIWSDRYRQQPLVIQGPGAGAHVTAAALLDDVLRIAGRRRW